MEFFIKSVILIYAVAEIIKIIKSRIDLKKGDRFIQNYYYFYASVYNLCAITAFGICLYAVEYYPGGEFFGVIACTLMMLLFNIQVRKKWAAPFIKNNVKTSIKSIQNNPKEVLNYRIEKSQKNVSDIPGQIRKLGELKSAGLLTDEEFNLKKGEMLDRM